jgi:hypothetical protein
LASSRTRASGVPIEPTAAHKASGDWYERWMHEWLALDWGQRCRYQGENRALPPASARRVGVHRRLDHGGLEAGPA